MKTILKRMPTIRIALALLSVASGSAVLAQNSPIRLRDVKTVWVSPFEGTDVPGLRDKVVERLARSGKIQVVEDGGLADAVLAGTATYQEEASERRTGANRHKPAKNYTMELQVQLTGRDKNVLWSHKSKHTGSRRIGTIDRVGDDVRDRLIKAIEKDSKLSGSFQRTGRNGART